MLAEAGGVSDLQFTPPILHGVVRSSGGTTVNARLKLGAGRFEVDNLCSCRQAREVGTICAHVVALVYAHLNQSAAPAACPAGAPYPEPPSAGVVGPDRRASRDGAVPVFKRVACEDALPRSEGLELAILLPLEFAKSWKSGELRIILEGSINGGLLRRSRRFRLSPTRLCRERSGRSFAECRRKTQQRPRASDVDPQGHGFRHVFLRARGTSARHARQTQRRCRAQFTGSPQSAPQLAAER